MIPRLWLDLNKVYYQEIIFDSCIQRPKNIEFSLGFVYYGEITAELNWSYYLSEYKDKLKKTNIKDLPLIA